MLTGLFSYLGRSSGAGSLAFWTHNLKTIQFSNYTSKAYQGPAARLGAGVQAFEAYTAASLHGLHVVGGNCPTVGLAGGYSQGAGHSPLSGEYGLGADQVLEWEVVTPNGHYLVATPEHHQDLYWALSGGGGGTYGVVLSMTVKAYPDKLVGGAQLFFSSEGLNETFWELIGHWIDTADGLAQQKISIASFFTEKRFGIQAMSKVGASEAEMLNYLRPFTDELVHKGVKFNFTTSSLKYLNHVDHYLGPLPFGIYAANLYVGGRLIPRSVVQNDKPRLLDAFRQIAEAGFEVDVLIQNVSHSAVGNDPSSNAVNPAWRNALMHIVVANYWDYSVSTTENQLGVSRITEELMPKLYDITPGSGSYINEADWQSANWKWDFFGSNFNRLKAIKKKYDEAGLLYAWKTVGSEDWEITSEKRLCRVK
jgi:hypothetical protein